ncbi:MAG: hypothetical protein RRZ24_05485 [Clostridia bacterium]
MLLDNDSIKAVQHKFENYSQRDELFLKKKPTRTWTEVAAASALNGYCTLNSVFY